MTLDDLTQEQVIPLLRSTEFPLAGRPLMAHGTHSASQMADLRIRARALALMHELIAHDWLDHDYIAQHTLGWEQLRDRALQWPPERAAEVCGIPVEQIRQLARAWGTAARHAHFRGAASPCVA